LAVLVDENSRRVIATPQGTQVVDHSVLPQDCAHLCGRRKDERREIESQAIGVAVGSFVECEARHLATVIDGVCIPGIPAQRAKINNLATFPTDGTDLRAPGQRINDAILR
jgi:hypothetical protein